MIDRGWMYHPALRQTLAFSSGIALMPLVSTSIVLLALAITLAAAGVLVATNRRGLSLILAIIVLLAGMLHARPEHDPLAMFEGTLLRRADIVGRIAGDPIVRNGRLELTVAPDSILYRSGSFRPAGDLLITVSDTAGLARLDPRAGDHISAVGAIAVPAGQRAPWEIDAARYMKSRGVALTASVRSLSTFYLFDRGDLSLLESLVVGCRRFARTFAEEMVGAEEGDIVLSLLVGERSGLDAGTREAFLATGTIHVLAVSGLHVGLIALVLGVALSWIPSRGVQLPLFLAAILLYVVIVGGGPSIVRAAVMGGAFMGARLAGRISRPINTLSFAALVVLLIDPRQLYDIGFHLSFASVAGIVLLSGALRRRETRRVEGGPLRSMLRRLGDALWLSFTAQLFTLPFLLLHFGSLPTMSLPANLLVVPLTTIALGAGLAGSIALPVVPAVAEWFGASVYLASAAALAIVRWSADIPPGAIEVATISTPTALLLLLGLVLVSLARSRRQLLFRGVIWLMLLMLAMAVEDRIDPIRSSREPLILWYPTAAGSELAIVAGDTLAIYSEGEGPSAPASERLRRWIGARDLVMVPLDSSITRSTSPDLMLVNDLPPEYLLEPHGLILSLSRQGAPGIRRIGGRSLLRLSLGQSPGEAILLRRTSVGGKESWEVLPWR